MHYSHKLVWNKNVFLKLHWALMGMMLWEGELKLRRVRDQSKHNCNTLIPPVCPPSHSSRSSSSLEHSAEDTMSSVVCWFSQRHVEEKKKTIKWSSLCQHKNKGSWVKTVKTHNSSNHYILLLPFISQGQKTRHWTCSSAPFSAPLLWFINTLAFVSRPLLAWTTKQSCISPHVLVYQGGSMPR